MTKLIIFLSVIALSGCALTAPDGKKELMEDIDHDRNQKKREYLSFDGQPIFVKVRAYSQVREGNIYGKQWILMQLGKEKVDIDKLMNDIDEK